jgi:hypothetical protein
MPVPDLVAVDSSAVEAVGYDAGERELYVRYRGKSGGTYVYGRVTPREYRDLLAADSIGGYVNKEIKPRHPYRQLDG